MTYRMTKSNRIARERLIYHMWMMSYDADDLSSKLSEVTPRAWHTIAQDIDCVEPKEKLTLYLDKSVARTFKAMGKGYQGVINRLLQVWLQMKAAEMLEWEQELQDRQNKDLDARAAARKAGDDIPIVVAPPGSTTPTEAPPEVDW